MSSTNSKQEIGYDVIITLYFDHTNVTESNKQQSFHTAAYICIKNLNLVSQYILYTLYQYTLIS